MSENGINAANISRRLGCSSKQVRRIKRIHNIRTGPSINHLLNTEEEPLLWVHLYNRTQNFTTVARAFGRTRQAIEERLRIT